MLGPFSHGIAMHSPVLPLTRVLAVAVLLALASLTAAKTPKGKVCGMAFTSGHDLWAYRQPFSTLSLKNLKKTGTDYVHITVIYEQNSLTSLSGKVITDYSSMRFIIRKAHRLGFKVFLKPIVYVKDGKWRGYIKGGPKWFNKLYVPWITTVAKVAQQEGVEMFSVGSELMSTLGQRKNWVNVINKVKMNYKGYVTYVANHDSFKDGTFWDVLDFISISGYFRLLQYYNPKKPPSRMDTFKLWKKQADDVLAWRNRKGLSKKKILLAEAGAQSKGGGIVYVRPWAYRADGPLDFGIQALIYEALFKAFLTPDWSLGVMLYEWDARPNAGKTSKLKKQFTPQNKPALKVMTKWFKQEC